MRVSVVEAKNRLEELLRAVENGEQVTVCREGIPVVDLVRSAEAPSRERKFGTLRGKIQINDPDWARAMNDEEVNAFLEGRY